MMVRVASRLLRLTSRGITLIEAIVVVAIAAALITLVGPSFRDMILVQRLRAINAQLITDLQFARAEAAARNEFARFRFGQNAAQTCYVIYTSPDNALRCDCRNGAGGACTGLTGTREIKTVNIERSSGISLSIPASQVGSFAFDHITGGIYAIPTDLGSYILPLFRIDASIDASRKLSATVIQSGRMSKCAPSGSTIQEVAC
jgi:type IV fimbrial biogenesis protein FimT